MKKLLILFCFALLSPIALADGLNQERKTLTESMEERKKYLEEQIIFHKLNKKILIKASIGSVEEIKELIGKGASIHARDRFGNTILHEAVRFNVSVAEFLIKEGFDINAINRNGWRPLHTATALKNLPAVKLLVENGAELDHKINDGLTALHLAKERDAKDIAKYLKESGAVDFWSPTQKDRVYFSVAGTLLLMAGASCYLAFQ